MLRAAELSHRSMIDTKLFEGGDDSKEQHTHSHIDTRV